MSSIQCPYCSEQILATAKKCKHCGEFLNKEDRAEEVANQAWDTAGNFVWGGIKIWFKILMWLIIIMMILGILMSL